MNRIWVRLFIFFIVVLAAVVGTISLYTYYAVGQEFARYVTVVREAREQRIARYLAGFYAEEGGWTNAQHVATILAQLTDERVVVVNDDDLVVADSASQLLGRTILVPVTDRWQDIVVDEGVVGRVFLGPPGGLPPPRFSPRDNSFLAAMNRSIGLAVGIGSALAVAFCFLLSRRIVRPIEAIMRAARRMEQGDLSQRVDVQRQDEVGQLAAAFNSMAAGLERSQRSRQQMVNDIAHELRTPLSNLRGYIEGIRDGVVKPDAATLEVLYEEAMLLSQLVDDLQELSLAEAGQLSFDRQPIAPADLVRASVAATHARALEGGIDLVAAVADDLPPVVADARRTRQVLHNLLNNALAHTPAGGQVTVSAARGPGQTVEFRVTDTGAGIRPADLPFIFDRFYRADRSRSRATGGVGIGLTIAKQLVVAQGGTIGVESEPGVGSSFHFTLPLAPPDLAAPRSARPAELAHPSAD